MAIKFDVKEENGKIVFVTDALGNDVIRAPLLNKGTAFTKKERNSLGLIGLLPPRVLLLKQQIVKMYQRFKEIGMIFEIIRSFKNDETELPILKKTVNISRFNLLRDLHDRNEILFYAFCDTYLEETIPIIYTPTVGDAVMRYSRDSARFRGIFLSPKNISSINSIFKNFRFKRPTIAVVTDNQGILGIGDQGVGGIDIPIGKLSLYVLGAGIRPWETMPLTLDVGTDNSKDLNDPYYLGYKTGRLKGEEYDDFIDLFIDGIKRKFPDILIQWEDFSRQNAFTILDRYRDKIMSFNDDIQGTGSVALAGILNALRASDHELKDQRFVVYGAGAGGIGIARQISECLKTKYKNSEASANGKIAIMDSRGLVTDRREVDNYKKSFSKKINIYEDWDVENINDISLIEVIKNFMPTVLIGTSGQQGHFNEMIIKQMSKNTDQPIIFPLSNPNSNSEATPQEIYKYSKGKAIVATGSPFDSFMYDGNIISIGQGNNFFIFPGVGLGAILSKGDYINDSVFTEAAYTLSKMTSEDLIKKGTVYPSFKEIRDISANIALSTANQIADEQGTKQFTLQEIKSKMWKPVYHNIEKI